MADIAMCINSEKCKLRETCYRAKAAKSYTQSYCEFYKDGMECEFYLEYDLYVGGGWMIINE